MHARQSSQPLHCSKGNHPQLSSQVHDDLQAGVSRLDRSACQCPKLGCMMQASCGRLQAKRSSLCTAACRPHHRHSKAVRLSLCSSSTATSLLPAEPGVLWTAKCSVQARRPCLLDFTAKLHGTGHLWALTGKTLKPVHCSLQTPPQMQQDGQPVRLQQQHCHIPDVGWAGCAVACRPQRAGLIALPASVHSPPALTQASCKRWQPMRRNLRTAAQEQPGRERVAALHRCHGLCATKGS